MNDTTRAPGGPDDPHGPHGPDPDEDDFEALLEESLQKKRRSFRAGDRVKAKVVLVGAERLALEVVDPDGGPAHDALMELSRLGDDVADALDLSVGDVVDARVLGVRDRVLELGLGRGGGRGLGATADIDHAAESGLPVQGTVLEVNKGGYVVDVGGTRCFCPLGAMDVRRIEDPATMVGRRLEFRVTERRGGRDVVLSRRALLEEENARRASETRASLAVGAVLRGTVTNVREFGAFVDLGGLEGMVPAGEIAFGRVDATQALAPGREVDVKVLALEPGKDGRERITLSMKALLDDPFFAVAAGLEPGTVVAGRVRRTQPFGAFVELVPGVEGLVHVSAFGRRIGHPADVVKDGQEVAVRVEGVDTATRRISLHLSDAADLTLEAEALPSGLRVLRRMDARADAAASGGSGPEADRGDAAGASQSGRAQALPPPRVGDVVDAVVDRAETYGVFVSWPAGRGLVPGRELGTPRQADLRRLFPAGTAMKVAVIDIRDDGKITLSRTAVDRAEERANTDEWLRGGPSAPIGRGLGTLGELMNARKPR